MSGDRAFLDTNVLVYANDTSEPIKRARARELVARVMEDGSGHISTQVLAEFWIAVTARMAVPLDKVIAEHQLSLLLGMHVVSVDPGIVVRAVHLCRAYSLSYWDAQIVAAAEAAGCSLVWSEDMSDGSSYASVLVRNPFGDL
jgi:predicted nucleic acid-binding protein